jgi:hypothetical protein
VERRKRIRIVTQGGRPREGGRPQGTCGFRHSRLRFGMSDDVAGLMASAGE